LFGHIREWLGLRSLVANATTVYPVYVFWYDIILNVRPKKKRSYFKIVTDSFWSHHGSAPNTD